MANYAHTLTTQSNATMLLGQKNAPEITNRLVATLDFAVLEECLQGGVGSGYGASASFCDRFQPYIAAGKPVFQIEYPASARSGTVSGKDYAAFCSATKGNDGFSKILKVASDQVDGWSQYCDGTAAFKRPVVEE